MEPGLGEGGTDPSALEQGTSSAIGVAGIDTRVSGTNPPIKEEEWEETPSIGKGGKESPETVEVNSDREVNRTRTNSFQKEGSPLLTPFRKEGSPLLTPFQKEGSPFFTSFQKELPLSGPLLGEDITPLQEAECLLQSSQRVSEHVVIESREGGSENEEMKEEEEVYLEDEDVELEDDEVNDDDLLYPELSGLNLHLENFDIPR